MLSLKDILKRFNGIHILSVGDVMMDRFVQGKVERISPEAPVPVFQFVQEKKMLGGAGNVVANLQSLSCHTYFVSLVGDDDFGDDVENLLSDLNCKSFLLKANDRPTIMKARFIAGNNHILRFDKEKLLPLTQEQESILLQKIKEKISHIDIVLLSDYAKGLLSETMTQKIIELAHQFNKKVLIDPKGNDYSKYKGAFLVKPNRKELEAVSGQTLDYSSENFLRDVATAGRYVLKKYSIDNMIVTLSEKGMLYVSADASETEIYLPTFAREVFDVSGAGDTSLATLGASLAVGAKIGQAMEMANIASGIVVGKVGTATVSVDEIQERLK